MTQQVALVTGGSRGIGAACAIALGRAGYKVAVHYRSDEDAARQVVSEIGEGQAIAYRFDLTREGACADLVKAVKTELGSLDVLVNNAGLSIDQILPLAKPSDFDLLLNTNLKPVFLLAKAASRVMIKQKSGRIINITSVVGHTGNPGQSMYAATKAAITAFTQSIAQELGAAGILANCVAPGFIETDMTKDLRAEVKQMILSRIPLKRLGRVDEVAAAVDFLASAKASYITGTTLHVNGGMFTS